MQLKPTFFWFETEKLCNAQQQQQQQQTHHAVREKPFV